MLFRAACELGAIASGGPTDELAQFGERIGLAFQVFDDVLDVTGPPEQTGKPRGADLLDGTVTLPLILARDRDPELHGARPALASERPQQASEVCARIARTDALEVAREEALELVTASKQLLPELPERQRAALELVADGVVERYS